MNALSFCITNECNTTAMGNICRLTLKSDTESVVLNITENQMSLINSRHSRTFFVRCKKEKIIQEIENAANSSILNNIAKEYYLCDTCDFSGINLYGVKRILKVIVECLYKYPKLRNKICFIGTHQRLDKLLINLQNGDKDILNMFNLQYICSIENAKKLGKIGHNILTKLMSNHENYIATAICAFGFFDGILLDQNDYDGYAYLEVISNLRKNEANGFHPKGCYGAESVVYHEIGHLLDNMCGLSDSKDFQRYHNNLTQNMIRSELSEYACTSSKEFVAEAFAEYMCNPSPRAIATTVGIMLDKMYSKA